MQPPNGYHSIVAQGNTDPEPKGNKTLKFDGEAAYENNWLVLPQLT